MFFPTAKATKGAITHLRPIRKIIEINCGQVPQSFFQNNYLLGFCNGLVFISGTATVRGKLNALQKGNMVKHTLEEVFPEGGCMLFEKMVTLMENKDNDFKKGYGAAYKLMSVAMGAPYSDNDPDIIEAKKIGQLAGSLSLGIIDPFEPEPPEIAEVYSGLIDVLFTQPLRKSIA